jgi:hypothetical protein
MQGVFMLIGLVFVLGWILPLVQGIVRIRAGGKGTWLIAFACVWAFVAIGIASLGVCVYVAVRNRLVSEELDMAAYGGPTGTIVSPYRSNGRRRSGTGEGDFQQRPICCARGTGRGELLRGQKRGSLRSQVEGIHCVFGQYPEASRCAGER